MWNSLYSFVVLNVLWGILRNSLGGNSVRFEKQMRGGLGTLDGLISGEFWVARVPSNLIGGCTQNAEI
jgi:hypothetical protein